MASRMIDESAKTSDVMWTEQFRKRGNANVENWRKIVTAIGQQQDSYDADKYCRNVIEIARNETNRRHDIPQDVADSNS